MRRTSFQNGKIYPMEMRNATGKNVPHPLIKAFRNFLNKFVKNTEDFPVKYYKKNKHYSKIKDL